MWVYIFFAFHRDNFVLFLYFCKFKLSNLSYLIGTIFIGTHLLFIPYWISYIFLKILTYKYLFIFLNLKQLFVFITYTETIIYYFQIFWLTIKTISEMEVNHFFYNFHKSMFLLYYSTSLHYYSYKRTAN